SMKRQPTGPASTSSPSAGPPQRSRVTGWTATSTCPASSLHHPESDSADFTMTTTLRREMDHSTIVTRSEQDQAKLAAGHYAAQNYVTDGGRIGLGSGTTSHYFV